MSVILSPVTCLERKMGILLTLPSSDLILILYLTLDIPAGAEGAFKETCIHKESTVTIAIFMEF